MARYSPQSQSRELMAQKKELALKLLAQGLTVKQISGQLRCAPAFIRRIRNEHEATIPVEENVA